MNVNDDVWIAKTISFLKGLLVEQDELGSIYMLDTRLAALIASGMQQLKAADDADIEHQVYTCPQCGSVNTHHYMFPMHYIFREGFGTGTDISYETEVVECNNCAHHWSDWLARDEMIAIYKYMKKEQHAKSSQ